MIVNARTLMTAALKDIDGNVTFAGYGLGRLPESYGHIIGNFDVSDNSLTSLIGAPVSLDGDFDVSLNPLTSLNGCPTRILGSFSCSSTKIKNLIGGPEVVNHSYSAGSSTITSLDGLANSIGSEFTRSPIALDVSYCAELTSLIGINKHLKVLNGVINLNKTPIKEGGLGLLMIRGITGVVSNYPALKIIDKYIKSGTGPAGMYACKRELQAAGLEAFAQI